jgi:hypothetical protein
MIEHRHNKRVAASGKISIYHRGALVADCKMKDISTEGMAIWAGPLQYHRNTMLEVDINSPGSGSHHTLRIPAIVVYSATKVLGLMFTQVDEIAQLSLRQIMNKAAISQENQPRAAQGWEKVMGGQPI